MTLTNAFGALRQQVIHIDGLQKGPGAASAVDLAALRSLNDDATTALLDFMDTHSIPLPPAQEPEPPAVPDPPSVPTDELRPPTEVPDGIVGVPAISLLQPVDLKQWNQLLIDANEELSGLDVINFAHIALHHGSRSGVLEGASIRGSRISNGGKWAGRLYRVGGLFYDLCEILNITPEHGTYVNVASGGQDPVSGVCLGIYSTIMDNIGGQAVQTVLEERSIDDQFGGDPMLRMNETPDWESDIQPGGWLDIANCLFRHTAQHESRGSFAVSHFRSRHHVALRSVEIDNERWADGSTRDVCRGHLMVQGCEEYRDGSGVTRPAWDRHVLVEDCKFLGRSFNQPLMLLEKGLHDIRIRRVVSRSTGGQDFIRVRGFDTSKGNLLIEDWDGPGYLELNGKNVGRLDAGFQS